MVILCKKAVLCEILKVVGLWYRDLKGPGCATTCICKQPKAKPPGRKDFACLMYFGTAAAIA
jgi:hypothetical protein